MASHFRDRIEQLQAEAAALQMNVDALKVAYEAEHVEPPPPPPPPPPTNVIRVKRGENLAGAILRGLEEGMHVAAAPGEHFLNFTIPNKPWPRTIMLTTDTTDLPSEGLGITREREPGLAILKSANNLDAVLDYAPGSTGLNLVGVGIGSLGHDRTMIRFGTDQMRTVEEQPHDVIFDRVLFMGHPETGQRRGIQAHCRKFTLINSAFYDMFGSGNSWGVCVGAWNGGQQITIRNCGLEAGAMSVLIGGSHARTEQMAPSQWLIEQCEFSKREEWIGRKLPTGALTVQCHLETKHVRGLILRHNWFRRCWPQTWDSGVSIVIKEADQFGDEPWTWTTDVEVVENVIEQVGMFMSIVGSNDDARPNDRLMKNLAVRGNLVRPLGVGPYVGARRGFFISNVPENTQIEHNTILGNSGAWLVINFNEQRRGTLHVRNNVAEHGAYGIWTQAGLGTTGLEQVIPGRYEIKGNGLLLHPDRTVPLPPTNTLVTRAAWTDSLDAEYRVKAGSALAAVQTTDGTVPGADIDRLKTVVPEAFA